jgi:rubrerythrin
VKEFALQDIIHHAQRIEQESNAYYARAEGKVSDQALIDLLRELAAAEIEHFNRLRKLVNEKQLTQNELRRNVSLNVESLDMLVPVDEIPDDPSARDILSTALRREQNTRNLYQRLLAMTNLSPDLADTFEYLVNQETAHADLITLKLRKLDES